MLELKLDWRDNEMIGPWDPAYWPPSHGKYTVEFVCSMVTFDRMQNWLRTLVTDESCISAYLYHRLLGHEVEEKVLENVKPRDMYQ